LVKVYTFVAKTFKGLTFSGQTIIIIKKIVHKVYIKPYNAKQQDVKAVTVAYRHDNQRVHK